jgi:hypothetical protein
MDDLRTLGNPINTKGIEENRLWCQAFDLARLILEPFFSKSRDEKWVWENAYTHVAHTNSAKCTQNKKGGAKADNHLFQNCREFMRQEIIALEPNIVVTFGVEAWASLGKNNFPVIEETPCETLFNGQKIEMPMLTREVNGRKVVHINMPFPTQRFGHWDNHYAPKKQLIADNAAKIKALVEQCM